jgi:hypothetical protein
MAKKPRRDQITTVYRVGCVPGSRARAGAGSRARGGARTPAAAAAHALRPRCLALKRTASGVGWRECTVALHTLVPCVNTRASSSSLSSYDMLRCAHGGHVSAHVLSRSGLAPRLRRGNGDVAACAGRAARPVQPVPFPYARPCLRVCVCVRVQGEAVPIKLEPGRSDGCQQTRRERARRGRASRAGTLRPAAAAWRHARPVSPCPPSPRYPWDGRGARRVNARWAGAAGRPPTSGHQIRAPNRRYPGLRAVAPARPRARRGRGRE